MVITEELLVWRCIGINNQGQNIMKKMPWGFENMVLKGVMARQGNKEFGLINIIEVDKEHSVIRFELPEGLFSDGTIEFKAYFWDNQFNRFYTFSFYQTLKGEM